MPLILMLVLASTMTLVNPALQPSHLWERHLAVAAWTVSSLGDGRAELVLRHAHKGTPAATVALVAAGEAAQTSLSAWRPGELVVALVGEASRRGDPGRILFYAGTRASWQIAQVQPDGSWRWDGPLRGNDPSTADFGPLWGSWNGHVQQLDRLFADLAAGRCYYPTTAHARFAAATDLTSFAPGRVRGLALRDFDGDGNLDLVCASPDGLRALRGLAGGGFAPVPDAWGLADQRGWMLAAADADGDGHEDLLLDGRLLRWHGAGFVADARLPTPADGVAGAAFIAFDGDGRPDVLLSLRGGGLQLWLNRGSAFVQERVPGLEAGDGLSGLLAIGDRDGEGGSDAFLSAGRGVLLRRQDAGFVPEAFAVDPPLSFASEDGGLTGVAVFAPLWDPARFDVLVATESRFADLAATATGTEDVTASGNEFAEGSFRLLGGLAEDLDADGTVDVLGLSCSTGQPNLLLMNRNYGSWMRTEKYAQDLLPGAAGALGALGAIAADLDGDGANDLILASTDGVVRVMRSLALADRPLQQQEGMRAQAAAVARSRILRIELTGPGRFGAVVQVLDPAGRRLARRQAGAGGVAGCGGPDAWSLAIRDPGDLIVRVRFADGQVAEQRVGWPDVRSVRVAVAHP